ncbi:MAG TPA: hypothetical protein VJN88_09055 [Ktedonobacterales bacterium]|nr:hypothetical protein [Ktedonobacterales bacterium]
MRSPLARDAQSSLEEGERLDDLSSLSDPPVWLTPPSMPMPAAQPSPAASDFTARVMARIQTESQPAFIGARDTIQAAAPRGRCRRRSRLRAWMVALVLMFGPALLLAIVFPGLAFAVADALLALLLGGLAGLRVATHAFNQLATNPAVLVGLALGCGVTAFGCAYHARHVYRLPRKR